MVAKIIRVVGIALFIALTLIGISLFILYLLTPDISNFKN